MHSGIKTNDRTMKIAYLLRPHCVIEHTNGIKSQALTWAESLRDLGHQVDLIDFWKDYDWPSYDAVHFFGPDPWANTLRAHLYRRNPRMVYSPIADPSPYHESRGQRWQKHLSDLTRGKFRSNLYEIRREFQHYKRVLVRTDHEGDMLQRLYDVEPERIVKVPLSFSHGLRTDLASDEREPFVLHISLFTQPRKNVARLVDAAKKYGFRLVIAGNPGTADGLSDMMSRIGGADNISVLGFVSEERKQELYGRARVFALPSLSEGVGIVAVDAAAMGCDIVVTDIGGPKEYYVGADGRYMAEVVDPYDVDAIGRACMRLLEGRTWQPQLSECVVRNYSPEAIARRLVDVYRSLS